MLGICTHVIDESGREKKRHAPYIERICASFEVLLKSKKQTAPHKCLALLDAVVAVILILTSELAIISS